MCMIFGWYCCALTAEVRHSISCLVVSRKAASELHATGSLHEYAASGQGTDHESKPGVACPYSGLPVRISLFGRSFGRQFLAERIIYILWLTEVYPREKEKSWTTD